MFSICNFIPEILQTTSFKILFVIRISRRVQIYIGMAIAAVQVKFPQKFNHSFLYR